MMTRTITTKKKKNKIFTVLFTSGSTGSPKGVPMLSHQWNERDMNTYASKDPLVAMSHMPLSHITDRHHVYVTLFNGGRVGVVYVVFERAAREFHFLSSTYSEYSLVSLTQLMPLTRIIPSSQEYHSNVTKYLTRASRSNTGTMMSPKTTKRTRSPIEP